MSRHETEGFGWPITADVVLLIRGFGVRVPGGARVRNGRPSSGRGARRPLRPDRLVLEGSGLFIRGFGVSSPWRRTDTGRASLLREGRPPSVPGFGRSLGAAERVDGG